MNITHKVQFETTKGNFTVGLYGEEMPVTVTNFINYVNAGFYNKLIFHRVIEGFMIQGGGFLAGMYEKKTPFSPIKLEICPAIKHDKYAISMARTEDPNSATAQFFVCTEVCDELDGKYAAFGKLIDGEATIDSIETVATKTVRIYDDVPMENIVINKVTLLP